MKTPVPTFYRLLVLLSSVLIISCSAKKSAQTDEPPPDFEHTNFTDVTPMLDGSAYARSADSRLWYIRGNKAVRVTTSGNASIKFSDLLEITPVLDGSAYAISLKGGLWYLHSEHAERVSEVSALVEVGQLPHISDKVFYALFLAERKKRNEAEERAENPPEPADSDDDYGSGYP